MASRSSEGLRRCLSYAARGAHEIDRTGVADDGGVFEGHPVERIEVVESRREQSVQRGRELTGSCGIRFLAEHRDELLDEERVATTPIAQDRDELVIRPGEQRVQQCRGVSLRERIEVDVDGVVTSSRLEDQRSGELKSRRSDDDDGCPERCVSSRGLG